MMAVSSSNRPNRSVRSISTFFGGDKTEKRESETGQLESDASLLCPVKTKIRVVFTNQTALFKSND